MPSSFMVKRDYAHCPLKKRPLALFNEHALPPEQEEPEDLSVKRPRLSCTPTPVISSSAINHNSTPAVEKSSTIEYKVVPQMKPVVPIPVHPVNVSQNVYYSNAFPFPVNSVQVSQTERISPLIDNTHTSQKIKPKNTPSLAEYYLQLFRSTSEEEAKRNEAARRNISWQNTPYLPPSPQSSPVAQEAYGSSHLNSFTVQSPQYFSTPSSAYPETSALISPVSVCSSTCSDSEDDTIVNQQSTTQRKQARHTCESCGKSYSTQSGLRKHNELHCSSLGSRIFSCKHCSKTYTSVGALKMHIRTHTLPCKCHVCGKAFSRPWLLQGHIRTHTGEKPFECQQCHRSFADRSNLRAHQQTHQRVKKYACQTCNKTFSRMSLLNKHSENVCLAGGSLPPNLMPGTPKI